MNRLATSLLVVVALNTSLSSSVLADTVFQEDFGGGNTAGWFFWPDWAMGPITQSSGHNYGYGDPASDRSPTADNGVAGAILGGNVSPNVHDFYYLRSPVIDISGLAGTTNVSFYRWLNSDYLPYMENVIDVFDGTGWINLWSSGGDPGVIDSVWTPITLDVTPYKNANFQVRFGYNVLQTGALTVSGWNIDDFVVGNDQATGIEAAGPSVLVSLLAPSPNPSVTATAIAFETSKPGLTIRVRVFDLSGRQLSTLFDGVASAGRHSLFWSGNDASGRSVASGMYVIALESGSETLRRRVTILR